MNSSYDKDTRKYYHMYNQMYFSICNYQKIIGKELIE